MSTVPYSRKALVRIIHEAGWPMVADRVVLGVCHDLNGRFNSLSSLSYLLSTGSREWDGAGPVVEEELKRAEESSRILRLLPDDGAAPQVLALSEFLPQVLSLVQLQPGFEGIEYEVAIPPDFPAVRMDGTLLLRSLSLLLTGVASEMVGRERRRIDIEGQADTRTLLIQPQGPGSHEGVPSSSEGESNGLPEDMRLRLAEVFRELGGDLASKRLSTGVWALELRFPVPVGR